MPLPVRKRASLVLLLVLATGLAAAAVAGAAATQDMSCCPAGMEGERGCTWLGGSDCCPERPNAPAPSNAAPPAPAACSAVAAPAFAPAPAALANDAPVLASRARSLVLRL
jgi:hypothetical protein